MKAVTYQAPGELRVERVSDPALLAPGDAILQVEVAAICGSDLHVLQGREVGLDAGTVMGHEFVGQLVACGPGVTRFRPGDRVVSPFTTSCGSCFYCARGLSARCVRGQLFGWTERGAGLHGGQAELVRVPLADTTLLAVPAELDSEVALLVGDVLATGFHAARLAGLATGSDCAILGCGPVGLMALLAARELGADRVFALDRVPERLALARKFGAETVPLDTASPIEWIRAQTEGRGVSAVLEAVGSAEAGALAFALVRPGGTIAVVGVHHEPGLPFSPGQAYDKNLTYRIGRCPARSYADALLPLALRRAPELQTLFTHHVGLDQAPAAYQTFADRKDGCIKVAIHPRG